MMAAAIGLAWLNAPPLVITLIIIPLAGKAAYQINRVNQRQEEQCLKLLKDADSAVRGWQERWQNLQKEAEQTITVISRMRDGVVLLNQSYEILLLNPAANYLLNLGSGRVYKDRVFHEVVRIPDLTGAVDASSDGKGPQKLLVEVVIGDSIRPIKARVDRFPYAGNHNLLITLRDETEARRIEEIRREFVANISHEFKTPLAAIKGYAETVELAIKDDPKAAAYFLAQIQTQCQRLERLIADMMQLARAQSGRSQMRITDISLSQVIAEAINSNAPVAEANGIELIVDLPATDVVLKADHEAILTIANNLISNAIRYTPKDGEINVSYRLEETFCTLVVKDTGVGITASDQKRIFERFYRVEKSRSTDDGGTGIGLSVVKNLAEALGGEVTVNSQPGSGSTFEVRLPRGTNQGGPHQH
ncbi:MAG: PAS domain-containing sensor histidine kinase [Planctomycetaceae bacterium]|nr:PAS domain-containing sensor histidine kinase [Planctomycetaceae bacterium]